jgi:hypothetical protein
MKTIAFAAAVAVAAVAVSAAASPAFAKPQASFDGARVTYDQKADRYCFSRTVTGALIPAKQCRTKEDWAREGVVIQHKNAVELARR